MRDPVRWPPAGETKMLERLSGNRHDDRDVNPLAGDSAGEDEGQSTLLVVLLDDDALLVEADREKSPGLQKRLPGAIAGLAPHRRIGPLRHRDHDMAAAEGLDQLSVRVVKHGVHCHCFTAFHGKRRAAPRPPTHTGLAGSGATWICRRYAPSVIETRNRVGDRDVKESLHDVTHGRDSRLLEGVRSTTGSGLLVPIRVAARERRRERSTSQPDRPVRTGERRMHQLRE